MPNRTSTPHAPSQILLVVVLVGKSNSGHISSSPASVPPFPVLRQSDTFTLKNFELLALAHNISHIYGNISCIAIKSKNTKFFHRVLKNNHWYGWPPTNSARYHNLFYGVQGWLLQMCTKAPPSWVLLVEEGDSSEVVAEQETRSDPSFLPFPIWLASAFYI